MAKYTGRTTDLAVQWSFHDCAVLLYLPNEMTEPEIVEVEKVIAMQFARMRRALAKAVPQEPDTGTQAATTVPNE